MKCYLLARPDIYIRYHRVHSNGNVNHDRNIISAEYNGVVGSSENRTASIPEKIVERVTDNRSKGGYSLPRVQRAAA